MAGTTEVSYIAGTGRTRHGATIQDRIGGPDLGCVISLDQPAVGLFKSAPDPNNADSVPNTSWWDSDWTCAEWILWHQANVARYGQQTANEKFLQYSSQVSGFSSDHFCPYQPGFSNYLRSQGIDIDNWVASLFATAGNLVNNAGQAATNTSDSLVNLTKVLKWLLPVGVVLVAAGGMVYLKNQYLTKPAVTGRRRHHGKR